VTAASPSLSGPRNYWLTLSATDWKALELRTVTLETRITTGNALNINQERKMHFRKLAKIIKLLRTQGGWLGRSTHRGRDPLFTRAKVDVYLCWSVKRDRDPANWYPMAKAMVDGFTDACLWTDDNYKHVAGPYLHDDPGKKAPAGMVGIRFEITELPTEEVTA
jgi:hypothetical protein